MKLHIIALVHRIAHLAMTSDHKFQLAITILTITPATILSWWALVNQRRQTKPRLQVLPSPITVKSITGESIVTDNWPGIVVRNLSPFSQRVCNVGYCIGKKFYTFGRPLLNRDSALVNESPWPWEIEPRSRAAFHADLTREGAEFAAAITPALKGKLLLEVGRAYAMTESGETFFSKPLSRKTRQMLHERQPKKP